MAEYTNFAHEVMRQARGTTGDQESMWDGIEWGSPAVMSRWMIYQNHFNTYAAGDWTVTETAGGATQALEDAAGGRLLLTNTNTENDLVGMQLGSEAFLAAAGKRIYFEIKFQYSEATEMDWTVGLVDTDTGIPLSAISEGIYFQKDDASTNIHFACSNSSVESIETGVATAAAATDIRLGFKVTGTGLVEYWVNGVKKGQLTTNIPTAETRLSFAIAAGSAHARTASIDYVIGAQEL